MDLVRFYARAKDYAVRTAGGQGKPQGK